MLEGFWCVNFRSSDGRQGAGVAVLKGGQVFGGDSGFTYTGTYTEDGDQVKVHLHIEKFANTQQSVFEGLNNYDLELSGSVTGTKGQLKGSPQGRAGELVVQIERRQTLP